MIRGILFAPVLFFALTVGHAAEPDKIPFKQGINAPRDLPAISASPTPAQQGAAYANFLETLKAWRSAKKRLGALESAGKTLQNDPAADKEVVAMLQLMAIEKTQEVENLRAQLAAILLTSKLEDPDLSGKEREQIIIRAAK